jgi:hypothetical protein
LERARGLAVGVALCADAQIPSKRAVSRLFDGNYEGRTHAVGLHGCRRAKHDDFIDAVEQLGAERWLRLRQTFSFIRSYMTVS